jgi:hypothetical protein
MGDGAKCRNILKDVTVQPTPQVTGVYAEEPRHSNLSNLDVKGIFSTCQKKGNDNQATGRWLARPPSSSTPQIHPLPQPSFTPVMCTR